MVDSVQVPVFMDLLFGPYEPPSDAFSMVWLQKSDQANGHQGGGPQFIFCRLPFGYKSPFSSGKFSIVEDEGLNTAGSWWKTSKKIEKKNPIEILCFPRPTPLI